ncbi:MAG TPA: FAD/NAD(P)-binding protein, partial [bacterium]|nr:FAD/NAD(P)-binding protein [bacterium]
EAPGHFVDWLSTHQAQQGEAMEEGAGAIFVSRGLYGHYLEELLDTAKRTAPPGVTLETCPAEVVGLEVRRDGGYELRLTQGGALEADAVILCLGNFPPTLQGRATPELWDSHRFIGDPWNVPRLQRIGRSDPVLIIGTGLTMVDLVISLEEQGHQGPIMAVSRRGLLPTTHVDTTPYPRPVLDPNALPTTVAELMRRIRAEVRVAQLEGRPWQSVVDAIRPVTQACWQGLPPAERRRFLRVVRPYWDIHRHRLAPVIAARIQGALDAGRLTVVAGHIMAIEAGPDRVTLALRRRRTGELLTFTGDHLVNCSGPESDYGHIRHPLVRYLLAAGVVRRDPLNLGLEITEGCALVNRGGVAAQGLYALGPVTRGAFWEITAVPDIRQQCAQFARRLVADLDLARRPRLPISGKLRPADAAGRAPVSHLTDQALPGA